MGDLFILTMRIPEQAGPPPVPAQEPGIYFYDGTNWIEVANIATAGDEPAISYDSNADYCCFSFQDATAAQVRDLINAAPETSTPNLISQEYIRATVMEGDLISPRTPTTDFNYTAETMRGEFTASATLPAGTVVGSNIVLRDNNPTASARRQYVFRIERLEPLAGGTELEVSFVEAGTGSQAIGTLGDSDGWTDGGGGTTIVDISTDPGANFWQVFRETSGRDIQINDDLQFAAGTSIDFRNADLSGFGQSGGSFPTSPAPITGDTFYLTTEVPNHPAGYYVYDGTNWIPSSNATVTGELTIRVASEDAMGVTRTFASVNIDTGSPRLITFASHEDAQEFIGHFNRDTSGSSRAQVTLRVAADSTNTNIIIPVSTTARTITVVYGNADNSGIYIFDSWDADTMQEGFNDELDRLLGTAADTTGTEINLIGLTENHVTGSNFQFNSGDTVNNEPNTINITAQASPTGTDVITWQVADDSLQTDKARLS